jgi:hypothetical protein
MKRKISTLFQIKESEIVYEPGDRSMNTADTYTFSYSKAINLAILNTAVKEIDGLKLGDSIITKEKVVLRVK